MGIEYSLRFTAPDSQSIEELVLQRLWSARPATPPQPGIELWLGTAEEKYPQATLQTEPGGLYFCDYCGGHGRALLGELVALLVSMFGPVTVDEL